jgi:hypothetical protein
MAGFPKISIAAEIFARDAYHDRVQVLYLHDRDLIELLQPGPSATQLEIVSSKGALPPDARIERILAAPERRAIGILISSTYFLSVRPGEVPPEFPAALRRSPIGNSKLVGVAVGNQIRKGDAVYFPALDPSKFPAAADYARTPSKVVVDDVGESHESSGEFFRRVMGP